MKPATGNNPRPVTKKGFIQLTLDELTFSSGMTDADFPEGEPVDIVVLTPRTMLVPREFFDGEHAGELLAANGMIALPGERIVHSDPQQQIVAVMAVTAEIVGQLEEKHRITPRYTTPLLRQVDTREPTVWMYFAAGLLYIKVYDRTLRFAGVIPAPEEADVLYFLERLGQEFRLAEYRLQLAGPDGNGYRKILKGYFNKIVCE